MGGVISVLRIFSKRMAVPLRRHADLRVSSVLNRDSKQFGKQHLTDGDEETCWNSNQGGEQWIAWSFTKPVNIVKLTIQFQGGVVGRDCQLELYRSCLGEGGVDRALLLEIHPEDSNKQQEFSLPCEERGIRYVKLLMKSSTDFFGRITVYDMDFFGSVIS